jgi:hypothetical protein
MKERVALIYQLPPVTHVKTIRKVRTDRITLNNMNSGGK